MKFAPVSLLSAGSMGASINSNGQEVSDLFVGAIQAVWTGASAAGTLILQISADNVPIASSGDPAANVVNWSTYTGSSTTVAGAGNFTWNLVYMGYKWVRVSFSRSGGTGSLSVNFMGKG